VTSTRFALTKFCPVALPGTLVERPGLAGRLSAGAGRRLTVVATAPAVTAYLMEHAAQLRPDPYAGQLTAAALDARASQPQAAAPRVLAEPLTAAEQRVLKLLPTSTYLQMAVTLYISRNTVKTHIRAIYQKLGVTSRSEAIERALDLRLL